MIKIKELIGVMLVFGCLTWTAAVAADSKKVADDYKEVVSGRYYMMPKSAWLEINPLRYEQVFWFVEANGLRGARDIDLNTPIQSHASWETVRKAVVSALVEKKLLTKRSLSSAHPRELYFPDEWNRSLQQQLLFRESKTYSSYCKATLVVRAKRHSGALEGDLKWWHEFRIPLPDGECN